VRLRRLAASSGRGRQLGDPLLIAALAVGGRGLQQGLGLSQPGQSAGLAGQRLREFVAAGSAVRKVFALVGLGGLAQDLGDLGLEPLDSAIGPLGGVAGQLGAVQRHGADPHHPGGRAQPQGLHQEPGQRLIVADPEPRAQLQNALLIPASNSASASA
jgi:hypothetical protein